MCGEHAFDDSKRLCGYLQVGNKFGGQQCTRRKDSCGLMMTGLCPICWEMVRQKGVEDVRWLLWALAMAPRTALLSHSLLWYVCVWHCWYGGSVACPPDLVVMYVCYCVRRSKFMGLQFRLVWLAQIALLVFLCNLLVKQYGKRDQCLYFCLTYMWLHPH